jgi:aldose sugar dehydrogenase
MRNTALCAVASAATAVIAVIAVIAANLVAGAASAAEYRLVTVAAGLDHPWSVAFLPDGRMLVTERAGALRIVQDGRLRGDPVTGVPPVYARSQAGLFDVLPHPQFDETQWVYLSYAHGTRRANATRVARARLVGSELLDLQVIFTAAPTKHTPVHYGGRLLFLPDGTLLLTTGDGFDYREHAQRLDSLLGKTVRLNEDGSIPADNPFAGRADARPEIWTLGHRNPQGLSLANGRVYLHDHGPRGGDALHLLEPGRNYGWPVITYGVDYSGARISPFTHREGMEQPLLHWTPSVAPSGLAYYDGALFPGWRGQLLAGTLVGRDVRRISLAGAGIGQAVLFEELGRRIRDVRVAPDGHVYLLTDHADGELLRVEPAVRETRP